MASFDERYEAQLEEIEENEDTQKDKYITFLLGDEEYAIEIQYVNEIIGMQKYTYLPDMPDYIKGVIKLRNSVYPIIDARKKFHLQEKEYGDRTCIIIVTINDTTVGLIVDLVNEVLDIPEEHVAPPPRSNARQSYIKGIGKIGERVKIILDVHRMFSEEELSDFQNL